MQPPAWVNYELSEESAAVMARGLTGSSQAWGVLLAHAQAVLAARTDTRESETLIRTASMIGGILSLLLAFSTPPRATTVSAILKIVGPPPY